MLFSVAKQDLTICEYLVRGLKRESLHTEHDQENLLHNQFRNAISATISSLDSEEEACGQRGF